MESKHVLTGPLEQARGVIGRYPEADERYVFTFDRVRARTVLMVGVRRPLDVAFYVDGDLERRETLQPWVGYARAQCDRIVEQRPD